MQNNNKVDELLIRGLRRRYFRKPTTKDLSFGIIEPDTTYGEFHINIPLSMGITSYTFSIKMKRKKSTKSMQKWMENSFVEIIEAKDRFNQTKDIQYLPKIVSPFVGAIDEEADYWNGINKLCNLFMKIQLNKMTNSMKFGLLTREGLEFVKNINNNYTKLNETFGKFYDEYTATAKDLQIVERWSGGYDLKHALPSINHTLSHVLEFVEELITYNEDYYEKM